MEFVDYCSFQAELPLLLPLLLQHLLLFQTNSFGIHLFRSMLNTNFAMRFSHLFHFIFNADSAQLEDVMINISTFDAKRCTYTTNKCNSNNANEMKKKFMCKNTKKNRTDTTDKQKMSILLQLHALKMILRQTEKITPLQMKLLWNEAETEWKVSE